MKLQMKTYDIIVEHHCMDELDKYIKNVYSNNKVFIVTDDHVYDLYHKKIEKTLNHYEIAFVSIKPGETSKSFKTYQWVIKELIHKGLKRGHLIIALGGGVVGDLAGFVAATLYRGCPFIQIPTTLLAQVDSSIGGKVAVDLEEGKNLVGAFYEPVLVLIDPEFLKTLNHREYIQGVAEMIKAGLIKDRSLFNHFKTNDTVDIEQIIKALKVKKEVVLKDPYDYGIRMILNFGHTFGHAIEKKYNYQVYKHGEAISYGMLIALKIGIQKGITPKYIYDEVKNVLLRLGLVKEPLFSKESLLNEIKTDKKNMSDQFHFICIKNIGEAQITQIKEGA